MRWLAVWAVLAAPAAADTAFITNQGSEDLSVVDLDRGEVLRTTPIGGKPAGVAVAPNGSAVYVVSPEGKYVSVLGRDGAEVLRRIPLDGGPLGIAAHPSERRIYVADWYGARLWIIDPEAGVVGEVATGDSPSGIAVTPDGALVLSADRDSDQVTIADAITGEVQARVKVGIRPFGITIGPDGRRAFTADVGSNTVTVIDIAAARVLGTVPTGERPYAVAFAQGIGFATDQYGDTVTAFDAATLTPLGRIDVGEYPEGIAPSSDGRRLVVANWFSNSISVIDAETREVIHEIPVGDGPRAFGEFIMP